MSQHEHPTGDAHWNPAFRPDSHIDALQTQPEPPSIILEELERAESVEPLIDRTDVDEFYSGHPRAAQEQTPVEPTTQQDHTTATEDADKHPDTASVELDQYAPITSEENTTAPEQPPQEIAHHQPESPVEPATQPHDLEQKEDLVQQDQARAESPALIPEPSHDLLDNTHQAPVQDAALDEQPAGQPEDPIHEEPATEQERDDETDDKRFGNEYEYQGESTAADDAVDESARAPLLDDQEVMPTAEDVPVPPEVPAEPISEPVQEVVNDPVQEVVNDPVQEVVNEPAHEIANESAQEVVNDPVQEVVIDPVQEVANEPAQETINESAHEIVNEPAQDIVNEPTQEPISESIQEPPEPIIKQEQEGIDEQPLDPFAWGEQEPDSTFDGLAAQVLPEQPQGHAESEIQQQSSSALFDNIEPDDTFDALGIQVQPEEPEQQTHQSEVLSPSALFEDADADDTFEALAAQAPTQEHPEAAQPQPSNAFWDNTDPDDTFETLATQNHHQDPVPHGKHTYETEDGPVAASRATAIEEVLQEFATDKDASETAKPQEVDLAAMWSAALDDDEFLEDPVSVDPSGFFEDDGEGFLEDLDTTQPGMNIASPTQPIAVVDSQGVTQGFTAAAHMTSTQSAGRYTPLVVEQPRQRIPNPLTSPEFFSSARMPALAATAPAMYGAYGQSPYPASVQALQQPQQSQQRPAGPQSSQSFVDKAKGGYASPYDLPEDIVQPRTRAVRPNAAPVAQPNVPPPRSSSMASVPPPLARASTVASLATSSQLPSSQPIQSQSQPPRPATADKKSAAGFFEDLPVAPKLPRSRPSGAYTPGPASSAPLQPQPPSVRPGTMPPSSIVPPSGIPSNMYGGLQQPERLPLLPDELAAVPQHVHAPPAPPANARYSPVAPPAGSALSAPPVAAARFSPAPLSAPPAASSRYSPAPASQAASQAQSKYTAPAQGSRAAQPFLPRTSSPLAAPGPPGRSVSYQPGSTTAVASKPPTSMGPPSRRGSEQVDQGAPLQQVQSRTYAPPSLPEEYQNMVASPPRMSPYEPSLPPSPESRRSQPFTPVEPNAPNTLFSPPRRPHTQSPGSVMKLPLRAMTQTERPGSAFGVTSPTALRQQDTRQKLPAARRQFSADLSYAVPNDERAADSLERWKGSPIIRWSPSGALITSFPKQAPFYAAGHAIPTIKCTPGSVTIHESKESYPMDERNAKFPGPFNLKGKAKKKEVITWLTSKIEDLEKVHQDALMDFNTPQELKRRVEEKVVLWKMTKLFLEHDNKVEGNATAEAEARRILLPNLSQTEDSADDTSGREIGLQAEPINEKALTQIRKRLLDGKREDAVWYATEQKLWSHALLIASVSGPGLWKQVVQEFVRAQVKDAGENAKSLATLYEVFAGNWDESIDELVPPSARAGFQMISKSGPSAKNPLEGLDQWRETLGLIISNRSNNDVQAITALGKLLSKYGRVEAAHTCFLFARPSAKWGGADDATSDFVLLGADHTNQPHELALDLDSILLTEVYEYLLSITPTPGASPVAPHLQAYKLHHAFTLAEHGLRSEAQAYCDAIGTAVKASTRASPYYHAGLLSSVEDLNRCLSAAPQPSTSSWIPKPSMDKVSGSMWKRFNTFVAGDDDDPAVNGAGSGSEGSQAAGPFGKVSGDTPSVSRQASSTDLYSTMAMNGNAAAPSVMGTSAPSRYAPINAAAASRVPPDHAAQGRYAPQAGNTYSPRASLDSVRSELPERPGTGYSMYTGLQPQQQPQPRSSSTPFGAYLPQQAQQSSEAQPSQQLGVPRPDPARAVSDYRVQYSQPSSRRESVQSGAASVNNYSPRPSIDHNRYSPRPSIEESRPSYGYQPQPARTASLYQPGPSYTPTVPEHGAEALEDPASNGYEPVSQQSPYQVSESTPIYEPPQASFDEPQSSYEPPAASYDPESSSYAPHETGPSDEPLASFEPPSTSYESHTSSYEPQSSYEPPSSSYQPYEPEPDPEDQPATLDPSAPQPKKKSIMDLSDDEDDLAARAVSLKAQQKRDADAAADAAFRAAAEADAARDKESPNPSGGKKGWFGGWFKKGEGSLDAQGSGGQGGQQPGNKPIRAKLGEQNSFYFDPELKKWVNKKAGAEEAKASAPTPPPPRSGPPSRAVSGLAAPPGSGPPSRVPSAAGGPPSGPPSRIGTPGAGPPMSPPISSPPGMPPGVASAVPPGLASGPPSRPATSMSNASSIDDLLGAPGPRKSGGAKKGKRGGRYVDVMAK